MNIDKTRNLLDIQALGDHRRVILLETASVQLRVLDDLLKAVLGQVEEIVIEAPTGTTQATCLGLIGCYCGLRIRHNNRILTIADTTEQL